MVSNQDCAGMSFDGVMAVDFRVGYYSSIVYLLVLLLTRAYLLWFAYRIYWPLMSQPRG
jgi:hypothetical protein